MNSDLARRLFVILMTFVVLAGMLALAWVAAWLTGRKPAKTPSWPWSSRDSLIPRRPCVPTRTSAAAMMNSAGPEDFPHAVASGPAACPSRLEDCRCAREDKHVQLHACGVPGCGAVWTQSDTIVRLPGKQDLPRRYDRADLRVA